MNLQSNFCYDIPIKTYNIALNTGDWITDRHTDGQKKGKTHGQSDYEMSKQTFQFGGGGGGLGGGIKIVDFK